MLITLLNGSVICPLFGNVKNITADPIVYILCDGTNLQLK